MMRWALVIALLTAGCGKPREYGRCLASHHRAAWVQIIPIWSGKVMTMVPIVHPAAEVCDRWQYPDGR